LAKKPTANFKTLNAILLIKLIQIAIVDCLFSLVMALPRCLLRIGMAFHYANPFIIPMYNTLYPKEKQIPVMCRGYLDILLRPLIQNNCCFYIIIPDKFVEQT